LNVKCDFLQLMMGDYHGNTERHWEFRNSSANSSAFRILSQMTWTFILIPVKRSVIVFSYSPEDQKQCPVIRAIKGMSQIAYNHCKLFVTSLQAKKIAFPKYSVKYS